MKTALLFWIWIPIVLFSGYLLSKDLERVLYTDLGVISYLHIAIMFSVFLFISGLAYYLLSDKIWSNKLKNLHIGLTYLGFITIPLCRIIQSKLDMNALSGEFVEYENIESSIILTLISMVSVLLIVIAFIIYVFNIIRSMSTIEADDSLLDT